jgi:predicted kinase
MNDIYITTDVSKEPFIKEITQDKVINVTGQSGSGKSTYIKNNFNNEDYIIIDTDVVLGNQSANNNYEVEFKNYLSNKYYDMPTLMMNFDLIYKEILDYFKDSNKTIVIDCAQFHAVKDINIIKGKVIVIRTCIDECYKRTINRYIERNPDATEEELEKYKLRKKGIYEWYKGSNEFIRRINEL